MEQGFGQFQQQALKQTLSTQQIQYVKLLAMNTVELNSYLSELHTENPVVEIVAPAIPVKPQQNQPIDIASWISQRPARAGQVDPNNPDEGYGDTQAEMFNDERYDLQNHLKSQFDLSLSDLDLTLLDRLVYSIDNNGYLNIDTEYWVSQGFDRELIGEAVLYLKTLDPAGIATCSLTECLSIQLQRNGVSDPIAFKLVQEHLEDLALGHFQKIAKAVNCDPKKISDLYRIIKVLNPRPGAGFGHEAPTYILPDVTIILNDDEPLVKYNKQYNAQLSINSGYLGLAKDDAEAKQYINRKLSQAMWVIKSVQSRQNTIERIVGIIVEHQKSFFTTSSSSISPLRLKDVAALMQVHESTVSRAINEKYLECKKGIYPFKYFFTSSPTGECENADAHSSRTIKNRIKELVAIENPLKPLSDSALVTALATEGISIARRTIAKYREELSIPSSNLRKH